MWRLLVVSLFALVQSRTPTYFLCREYVHEHEEWLEYSTHVPYPIKWTRIGSLRSCEDDCGACTGRTEGAEGAGRSYQIGFKASCHLTRFQRNQVTIQSIADPDEDTDQFRFIAPLKLPTQDGMYTGKSNGPLTEGGLSPPLDYTLCLTYTPNTTYVSSNYSILNSSLNTTLNSSRKERYVQNEITSVSSRDKMYLAYLMYQLIIMVVGVVCIIIVSFIYVTYEQTEKRSIDVIIPRVLNEYLATQPGTRYVCLNPESIPLFPDEIHTCIVDSEIMNQYIACSWTTLDALCNGIVKRKERNLNERPLHERNRSDPTRFGSEIGSGSGMELGSGIDSGNQILAPRNSLMRYVPRKPVVLIKGYIVGIEPIALCPTPATITCVVTYGNYRVLQWEEQKTCFPEHGILIVHESCLTQVVVQTNIPELYVYPNISHVMYHQFEDHPFHEKRNEAIACQEKLRIDEISYYPLSYKHQRTSQFLSDIEAISKGLVEQKME